MKIKKIYSFLNTFTLKQWIWFYFGLLLVIFSVIALLYIVSKKATVIIPKQGGHYTEGIVGSIRYINPVLYTNENEKDLTSLVFKGLFTKDAFGQDVPLLASSYVVSEDGLVYTVTIRDDVYFHNKEKVTSADVVYTVKQIQDPLIKSPRQTAWLGVEVKALDEYTVEFRLKQRFADFLDTLSIGILSKKEWESVTPESFNLSEKNLKPVGTGPYMFSSLEEDSKKVPRLIHLKRNTKYLQGKPFIKKITLAYYTTEKDALDALKNEKIDTLGALSPENISSIDVPYKEGANLPRLFGVFFNKSKVKLFQDKAIIDALEYSIDKQSIVDQVFNGYATKKNGAVPFIESTIEKKYDLARANELMEKAGWKKNERGIWQKGTNELKFTLVTTDVDELKKVNILLQDYWNTFGADVLIRTYDSSTLIQEVLNPREYEVLLFGQVITKPSNLYSFWHSDERTAPGLNISMYVSQRVDTLLEAIKKIDDQPRQTENMELLEMEIEKDKPAIFLFEPMYISASHIKIFNRNYDSSIRSSRFYNVHEWSIKTDHVWSIFK